MSMFPVASIPKKAPFLKFLLNPQKCFCSFWFVFRVSDSVSTLKSELSLYFSLKSWQGDHLSGKPGNVREFETCQGKILSGKSVPKLFITSWIFAFNSTFFSARFSRRLVLPYF